jgi:hypothetical protein
MPLNVLDTASDMPSYDRPGPKVYLHEATRRPEGFTARTANTSRQYSAPTTGRLDVSVRAIPDN